MRLPSLIAAIGLVGSAACYSTVPADRAAVVRSDRTVVRTDAPRAAIFDAYTTNGDYVRIQQDARTGDLVVIDPPSMSGQRVAIVNADNGSGAPLVTIDTRARQTTRVVEGSGGDNQDRTVIIHR